MTKRHGVDAGAQRFTYESRGVQAQARHGQPEEVGGERVGEAELQLRVRTQHHEHHDDGQRQVLEQFDVGTGNGTERGDRRNAHHHEDDAQNRGEQRRPQGQLDVHQKRAGNVVLAEQREESVHHLFPFPFGTGGLYLAFGV